MERAQRVYTHMDNGLALVVAVVIMAAVFVLDVFTPLGFTVWVGYICRFGICLASPSMGQSCRQLPSPALP